jgi:hypothetical protein
LESGGETAFGRGEGVALAGVAVVVGVVSGYFVPVCEVEKIRIE